MLTISISIKRAPAVGPLHQQMLRLLLRQQADRGEGLSDDHRERHGPEAEGLLEVAAVFIEVADVVDVLPSWESAGDGWGQ